jgi:hypothetical protein
MPADSAGSASAGLACLADPIGARVHALAMALWVSAALGPRQARSPDRHWLRCDGRNALILAPGATN